MGEWIGAAEAAQRLGEWIGAAEAAQRLGVKQATLYAYVSRGVLHRRRGPDGRRSLFDPVEIDRLAAHGGPGELTGAAQAGQPDSSSSRP